MPDLEIDKEIILSSREALELRNKPETLAIIGASAIGCEFAYYFNAYGTEVTLFEIMDRIVPKEDEEISKENEFSEKIDELNQETDTLLEEIDKWQM